MELFNLKSASFSSFWDQCTKIKKCVVLILYSNSILPYYYYYVYPVFVKLEHKRFLVYSYV